MHWETPYSKIINYKTPFNINPVILLGATFVAELFAPFGHLVLAGLVPAIAEDILAAAWRTMLSPIKVVKNN